MGADGDLCEPCGILQICDPILPKMHSARLNLSLDLRLGC
jgi:hypothetical protein